MTNEDYQLEELENAAVNKSNNAKRAAVAAGVLAAGATGAGAAYAATNFPPGHEEEPIETLSEEDLEGVANSGANQVQQPEVKPEQPATPVKQETHVEEPEVTFDTTTHYYDDDHNLVATTEEGTIDGRQFTLIDLDNDNKADILAYDANGNGIYEENEIIELTGRDQIVMGNEATEHKDVFFASNDSDDEIEDYYDGDEKDYVDTIHNDFEDEKTGETYSRDYAENNENYNNNGDVEHYSASYEADNTDDNNYYDSEDLGLAQNDDFDDNDYYDSLAENDTTDDSFDDFGSDSVDIL